MKLPDFKENKKFDDIRKKMGIEDGYVKENYFDISFNKLKLQTIQFDKLESGKGLDVSLEELENGIDKTLFYKNKNVILYIRDQYDYEGQYKYHVSWCKTLKDMRDNNKLKRYVISRKTDGYFHVNLIDIGNQKIVDKNVLKKLNICKHCLSEMNYKGYNDVGVDKNQIYDNFSLVEFFEKYDSKFNQLPNYNEINAPLNNYPNNWVKLSYVYRKLKGWKCEKCGLDCSNNKSFLDVHHIDSNKYNNDFSNFKALCKRCHVAEYNHKHYKELMNKGND